MLDADLPDGLTHLAATTPRSRTLATLAVDQLPAEPAYWIDARNAAVTHTLYDCAPSRRVLEPLRIARAFTAYQHHELVAGLAERDPALVVAPNVAALYRDDDLPEWERADLLAATLEALTALECPVLASTATGRGAAAVAPHADATIEATPTREGLRLEGAGLAVAGYHGTGYWQTTIPYWVELCGCVETLDPVVAAHDRGLLSVEG